MTLSKRLREEVSKKLGITSTQQLLRRIKAKAALEGVVDNDIALLVLAKEHGVDVTRPRFSVLQSKLDEFKHHLESRKVVQTQVLSGAQRGSTRGKREVRPQRLLSFRDEYPQVFYKGLEEEINNAFNDPRLPNAVLVLSRKLIENLVYNILQYKLGPTKLEEYYDTKHRRPRDFGVLVEKLEEHKSEFDQDQQGPMDKFLSMVKPFKFEANSKTHNIMEYLRWMREVKKFEIPEMTQILVDVAARVKK